MESLANNAVKSFGIQYKFRILEPEGESLNDRRGRAAGETNSRLAWTMHPGVHRVYPILCWNEITRVEIVRKGGEYRGAKSRGNVLQK